MLVAGGVVLKCIDFGLQVAYLLFHALSVELLGLPVLSLFLFTIVTAGHVHVAVFSTKSKRMPVYSSHSSSSHCLATRQVVSV